MHSFIFRQKISLSLLTHADVVCATLALPIRKSLLGDKPFDLVRVCVREREREFVLLILPRGCD